MEEDSAGLHGRNKLQTMDWISQKTSWTAQTQQHVEMKLSDRLKEI